MSAAFSARPRTAARRTARGRGAFPAAAGSRVDASSLRRAPRLGAVRDASRPRTPPKRGPARRLSSGGTVASRDAGGPRGCSRAQRRRRARASTGDALLANEWPTEPEKQDAFSWGQPPKAPFLGPRPRAGSGQPRIHERTMAEVMECEKASRARRRGRSSTSARRSRCPCWRRAASTGRSWRPGRATRAARRLPRRASRSSSARCRPRAGPRRASGARTSSNPTTGRSRSGRGRSSSGRAATGRGRTRSVARRADAAGAVALIPWSGRIDTAGRSRRRRGAVALIPPSGRADAAERSL